MFMKSTFVECKLSLCRQSSRHTSHVSEQSTRTITCSWPRAALRSTINEGPVRSLLICDLKIFMNIKLKSCFFLIITNFPCESIAGLKLLQVHPLFVFFSCDSPLRLVNAGAWQLSMMFPSNEERSASPKTGY